MIKKDMMNISKTCNIKLNKMIHRIGIRHAYSLFSIGCNLLIFSLILFWGMQDVAKADDIKATTISMFETQFNELGNEFLLSQRRILSSIETWVIQQETSDMLSSVADSLLDTGREFGFLSSQLDLATLITTNKRNISYAENILNIQRKLMIKIMTLYLNNIDKKMYRVRDIETSRLMLQARDIFQKALEFTKNIEFKLPMSKAH